MKTVPLGGKKAAGRVALVDDADYDLVMRYTWRVHQQDRPGHSYGPYAITHVRLPDGRRSTTHMHKLITGWPQADHEDHDGLNNQRSNLRPATRSQNSANSLPRTDGTSPYKGVCWSADHRKWRAEARVNKRLRFLGYFGTEVAAAKAYDACALAAWGEYAYLNFPASA